MDAIPPALGIKQEMGNLAPPGRVLQEWERPAAAGDLDAPIKNYVVHLQIIL